MLHLVEGIGTGILDNKEYMVMAGDKFSLGENPELVFPDNMVDSLETGFVEAVEDILQPVPS
jgi:hypothetical protein